ncbi:hypothetical protein LTR36_008150 [Oleoguttula mirabilis]|uniref:Uncharacterized protein n=1 Tax=Oleoguttula mirabilis TaxID=1507867 RepID=A0AAV9J831_9PEZI|nr:hypothetical protein LTR36_008150 [Oleoguttula mirabilis]
MATVKPEPFDDLPFPVDSSAKDNTPNVDSDDDMGAEAAMPPSDGLQTASLDQLQSKDYRQVLDVVDRLRLCGLGSILQLPQLVVCGSQSAGKSSVLEAITEVPFPRKEGLCTRFATQIVMRRDVRDSIRTTIVPDKSRSEAEIAKLEAFSQSISDFSELPRLIEEAAETMDLKTGDDGSGGNKAFSRDVLSIEIAGPDKLQITLVDLPGLVNSATKDHSKADVDLIHELVQDYVSEGRTIMLAVISAKDDLGNQGILDKCRAVDKDGHRTLGVITKPDYILSTGSQTYWKQVTQNKNVPLALGWHMLKNRAEDQMNASFQERNLSEASFFASGWYRDLPANQKGIGHLRTRLAQLLYRHLKKELPNLQAELNSKHGKVEIDLQGLGEKRFAAAEQKRFLMGVSTAYQVIVDSAVDGHYEHDFFGIIDTDKGFEDAGNMRRLRAAVQHMNLQFASQMRQFGHKFRIMATDDAAGTNSKKDLPEPELMVEYAEAKSLQKRLSRPDAVQWVKNILVRTRGRELPGNFNPLLMSQLFWEQSEHWKDLARAHVDRVNALCSAFVGMAIRTVVNEEMAEKVQMAKIDQALKDRCEDAVRELQSLIEDKQRPPITSDPSYTAAVQESRARKTKAKFDALMNQAKVNVPVGDSGEQKAMLNPEVLQNVLKELTEPDMDKPSAEDALDCQLAYYKDKVTYFIAAVTDQVIERHLLHNLAKDTLSPMIINDMTDAEVGYVAAEPEETTHRRDFLEGQKVMLESDQETFRKALGSYK